MRLSEWGWNPGSFEAIGTVSAGAVALIALLVALAQGRSQRKFEISLRERDAERASRLVRLGLTHDRAENGDLHTLTLTNNSPLPIYPSRMIVTALTSMKMPMEERIAIPPSSPLRWAGSHGLPTPWHYQVFGDERNTEIYYKGLPEVLEPRDSTSVDFIVLPRSKPRGRWDGGGSWVVHVEFDNGYGEVRSTASRGLDGTQRG